jgi:autotransporter translocation and assembly factor TamB
MTDQLDADLSLNVSDTSLDPYLRAFDPELSPYTTAIASGNIRVVGELADIDHLVIDGTVDTLEMRLLDYAVKNAAPIRIALERQQVRIDELQLVGDDTRLRVSGTVGLNDQRIALTATGDANLGILQGFFRDVRGAGRAELTASIDGPLAQPQFSGSARVAVTVGPLPAGATYCPLPSSLVDTNDPETGVSWASGKVR